jgi:hypothetical protein
VAVLPLTIVLVGVAVRVAVAERVAVAATEFVLVGALVFDGCSV